MLKTVIVLPDGTELSSGVGTKNAIKSITVTECVNDAQELTLGSTCANMIELTAITPYGGFSIAEGDEFTVYREDAEGDRNKVGFFTAEKPTRASAHSLKVTAYDRISWLDKDLTAWIAGLTAWPYTLYDLAKMTCSQCGLELRNTSLPNGSYLVQHFSAEGITGRQIMKWVGEIAGRFCRATPDGLIEFAWYQAKNIFVGSQKPSITYDERGNVSVYIPGVTVETDGIGNVKLSGNGVMASDDGYGNVAITLTSLMKKTVASNENGNVTVISPGVNVEADDAGNVTLSGDISVIDDGAGNVIINLPDGETSLMYYQGGLSYEDYQVAPVKKVQLKGSEDDVGTVYPDDLMEEVNTYIISGNYLLSASDAEDLKPIAKTLYEQLQSVTYTPCKVNIPASFHIHAGDIVNITDRNGVTISAYVMTKKQAGQRDTLECTGSARRDSSSAVNEQSFAALNGKVLDLKMNVDGLRAENRDTAGKLASLSLDINGIVANVQKQTENIDGLAQNITKLQQDAESVKLSVQSIQDDGVTKVETETGFSFDQNGLHISKSDSDMENTLDESGMYVRRNGEAILQANDDGVMAVDVTVRNYLIVGTHARFEDYPNERTACFWL